MGSSALLLELAETVLRFALVDNPDICHGGMSNQ